MRKKKKLAQHFTTLTDLNTDLECGPVNFQGALLRSAKDFVEPRQVFFIHFLLRHSLFYIRTLTFLHLFSNFAS